MGISMNSSKLLWVLCIIAFAKANFSSAQQAYRQHQVALGESVPSITEKYNITANQLIRLNPDLRSGLKPGAVLLIPEDEPEKTTKADLKSYKVSKKETLYSISKQFNVTVGDLRKTNPELQSRELREGEEISIPLHLKKEPKQRLTLEEKNKKLGKDQYLVQPQDTYYGIGKKFDLTVKELKALNPDAGPLKPGMVLNVPAGKSSLDDLSDKFIEYTVPSKMTMWSLREMTGISTDSLVSLNPQLKQGLKAGMNLRIPNPAATLAALEYRIDRNTISLVDSISNFRKQRIALMLPLSLHKVRDSITQEDVLMQEKALRYALDFYSGVRIARDSMRKLGVNVELVPFDTQRSTYQVNKILASNDFSEFSAVLGPFISKNVTEVARALRNESIPVISPLTNSDVKLYQNLYQSRPIDRVKEEKMLSYIKNHGQGKNIIIISDPNKSMLKDELLSTFPDASILMPNENNYIYNTTIVEALSEEAENWVVLATEEKTLITVAISSLSAKAGEMDIRVIGFDSGKLYDQVDNMQLAKVDFTYPSVNRIPSEGEAELFYEAYRSKYSVEPSAYAVRGFDVAMDLFLRIASAEDLHDSTINNATTRYVENSFNYVKKFMSGYYNEAIYILEYQEDLSLREVAE